MISISLCMIVKNEEENLARCLNTIHDIVDEIIIVDTGSSDKTKEIARNYTQKLYDFPWMDDFAAARNYAFSKATCTYWLWLDADDVLLPEDREKLCSFKTEKTDDFDVAMMPYHVAFDEDENPTFHYFRERIIRRNHALPWQGAVHEVIAPFGKIEHLEIAICHKKNKVSDSNRNLHIYEKQLSAGHHLTSREQYYYARELYYHKRYTDAIKNFEEFLEKEDAWIENKIEACQLLSSCHAAQGNEKSAFLSLLNSFFFDSPRAEICCELGNFFFARENNSSAIYWYQQALEVTPKEFHTGFQQPDCYGFTPSIQLCMCHYRLGNFALAKKYNNDAGMFKSNHAAYLHNKAFFEQLENDVSS